MRYPLLVFIPLFVISCASHKSLIEGFTLVRYKESIPAGDTINQQHYIIDVPKGGSLEKYRDSHISTEYRITYPDSSVIYITNENVGGSRINWTNRERAKTLNPPKSIGDTLYLFGTQDNGLHWRDNFMGEMVAGYANVKPAKLYLYERALKSLRRYK